MLYHFMGLLFLESSYKQRDRVGSVNLILERLRKNRRQYTSFCNDLARFEMENAPWLFLTLNEFPDDICKRGFIHAGGYNTEKNALLVDFCPIDGLR